VSVCGYEQYFYYFAKDSLDLAVLLGRLGTLADSDE